MNKEPDWTLHNVGVMSEESLNSIIYQIFNGSEGRAIITRGDLTIKVQAPNKREVLSAAILGQGIWHVRAVEGLIVTVPAGERETITTVGG